jgi:GTPase SAR1 family protein
VGDEGAQAIAESLQINSSLQELDLVRLFCYVTFLWCVVYFWFVIFVVPILDNDADLFSDVSFCFIFRFLLNRLLQSGNEISVAAACRLVACIILNSPKLTMLYLDPEPSACVRHAAWRSEGLPLPPSDVVAKGWTVVLEFLRAGPTVPVHELRLMLIGDGEAGKTSLKCAFVAKPHHKAKWIEKDDRTVGMVISKISFVRAGEPSIKCQLCDFAGQAIYYFSHTLHFTRRCLYVLMWTSHKFSGTESQVPVELTLDEIVSPLKRWLQLLAANVPEASVLLVGTHCRVEPEKFESMRPLVEMNVHDEMERLRDIAEVEGAATREVLKQQQALAKTLRDQILSELSGSGLQLTVPRRLQLADVEKFDKELKETAPRSKRGLRVKSTLLLRTVKQLTRTQERLRRIHGVYDGSVPEASAPLASLKLVNQRSFAVDSIEGVGVAELLEAIEATCRDSHVLPFMGEAVPLSWLQVADALQEQEQRLQPQQQVALNSIRNCVISLSDAVKKVRALLQTLPDADTGLARRLDDEGVRSSLKFWSLLGRMFVYEEYFLLDPRFLVDLLKPLVHHNVKEDRRYRKEFCTVAPEHLGVLNTLLDDLEQRAVLDRRLLSYLTVWPKSSDAITSMLTFFQQSFMISSLDHASVKECSCFLVTARLCDSSNVKRRRHVAKKASEIEKTSEFFAVYVIPSEHIGFIAQMQATIAALRPEQVHLEVVFGADSICVKRGSFDVIPQRITSMPSVADASSRLNHSCSISVRHLDRTFQKSKLGSLRKRVAPELSHCIVVCSNDDGLFAFAARCVDEIIRSCTFGAYFESWLPCRPPHAVEQRAAWVPKARDWAQLSSALNPTSLSDVLNSGSSDVVLESHSYQLKDVLPRQPPIFMSHAYSGDGTGEFCLRLKKRVEDMLLCTVWFDKKEMGSSDAFIKKMQVGMQHARYFVICLTPLYLTRPHCLRELRWAMDMCAAKDSPKQILVLPLHPAVSYKGCIRIIESAGNPAHVFLPVNDKMKSDNNHLDQWRGHKLSHEAISLLQKLTGKNAVGIQADWLKLQPWLSDQYAQDWEEVSLEWADQDAVTLDALLKSSLPDMLKCVTKLPSSAEFSFAEFADDELASDPPSQNALVRSDAAVIINCYPRSRTLFSEQEMVSLVRIGLCDADVMGCVEHGYGKLSVVERQESADQVVRFENPVDSAIRLAAHMSGVDFEAARRVWLENNQFYVRSDSRDPLLRTDPEHQNFCKVSSMLEKVSAGIVPIIEEKLKALHAQCLRQVMSKKPGGEDEDSWKRSGAASEAWKTVLLLQHRNSDICKAAAMLNQVESGKLPKDDSDDPRSLYARCFLHVKSLMPADGVEDAWRWSPEQMLNAWKTVLSELLSGNKLTEDVDIKRVFQNVPNYANVLWSTDEAPHQIAKTFLDPFKAADTVKLICELDGAKLFNVLQYCKQFPDDFKPAAAAASKSRNRWGHLAMSTLKMSDEEYRSVFESMKKLLQCLTDPPRSFMLAEIQDLHAKKLQMVDVASVTRLQKETEYLRKHVAYLSSADHAKPFSLQLRADHSLKVVPNIANAASFTCKVRVADGPAAIGMHVAGAAVDAGSRLLRAADSLDGYISKVSIIDEVGAADSKEALSVDTSAKIGQDALVEVVVLKVQSFSFPGLQRDAERKTALIASLKTLKDSDGSDAAFKRIASKVIDKFGNNKLLSEPEAKFWDEFCRSPEKAIKLDSPPNAASAAAAASGDTVSRVPSPVVTPGPSPAISTAAPRALPQLLEALGIDSWFPVSRQKAWAQLIPDEPRLLSPSDQALLHLLGVDGLEPAQQEEWLHRERGKLAAAALTKDERAVLRRFAMEPSQTVDGMLRALDGHEGFLCVRGSSMPHAALYDVIKKREGELPAILPLKGDREFLVTELKKCKESARKRAAPPVAREASASVPPPAPFPVPASAPGLASDIAPASYPVLAPDSAPAPANLPAPDPNPASASGLFPSVIPPHLKAMSALSVASNVLAIGQSYEQDSQLLLHEGCDGKTVALFCGRNDGDVLRYLEHIGVESAQHRGRIMMAFKDLFEPQTCPGAASDELDARGRRPAIASPKAKKQKVLNQ